MGCGRRLAEGGVGQSWSGRLLSLGWWCATRQVSTRVLGRFRRVWKYPVQCGERLKARSVFLKDSQGLADERQRELFEEVFEHRLSVASVLKAERVYAEGLSEPLESVPHSLLEEPVVGGEETGLRVEGPDCRGCMRPTPRR
jgi:hypothetical protein